ncbi:hypothetical protein Q9L42_021050 (plasmid) [Methylomarinum sp. Ch1-1]|uniref:Uncharacterized protein n=1 Tax=Methylomarinum roseum TaxID=3067653 RepID=A0AAU7P0M1_9GAMM
MNFFSNKILSILMLFGGLMASQHVFAAFALEATQQIVRQHAMNIDQGVKQVDSSVQEVNSSVQEQISAQKSTENTVKRVGQALETKIGQNTTTVTKLFENQNQFLHDLMVEVESAKQRNYARQQFGEQATPDICYPDKQGIAMHAGSMTQKELLKKGNDRIFERNHVFNNASQVVEDLSQIKQEDIKPEHLVPKNEVYETKEARKMAQEAPKLVLNPNPPKNLKKGHEATSAGQKHTLSRKIYDERTIVPTNVHNRFIDEQMPTIEYDEWAANFWEEMRSETDPVDYPGAVPDDEGKKKMSTLSMLSLLSDSKTNNKKWYSDIMAGKSSEYAIRENTVINALRLKVELMNLRYMRDIAYMMAERTHQELNKEMLPGLDKLRVEANKQFLAEQQ